MSVNKAILLGNVGKEPEIRMAGEHKVATFSVATTERGFTKRDGTKVEDKTDWHNVVAWRGLADIIEKYVKKGRIDIISYSKKMVKSRSPHLILVQADSLLEAVKEINKYAKDFISEAEVKGAKHAGIIDVI